MRIYLPFALSLLLGLSAFPLLAQQLTVTGKVTSSEGAPLPGVHIQVKGAGTGTVTNERGKYAISVPGTGTFFFRSEPPPTLVFSYTGFKTMEVAVDGQTELDVELPEEAAQLEEIIVTGTAAGRSPKIMSYAVGKIDEKELQEVPGATLGIGMQGKTPGLRVNRISGQPGQGVYFQVRSANAIANGQQPMLIVDGVFLGSQTLADLNPEDIEKIEILKGSAGTSLYGSQAANGVVQIFTKRGRNLEAGETKVSYRGEVGYSEPANRYPVNEFTNREILDPSGPQPILGDPNPDMVFDTPLPNLQDYQENILFQNGLYQSHSLSVQGKTERTNFLGSVQRLRDEGLFQSSEGYTRHSFRLNLDHQISNKLELQASSMYANSRQDLLALSSNGPNSFLATTLFLTPMFDLEAPNEEDGSSYDWDIDNTGFGITNPLYDRYNSRQSVDRNRLLGSLTTNYYAKDWLTLSYTAALDRSVNEFEHFLEKGYLSTSLPGQFGTLATAGVQNSNGGGIQRTTRITNSFISRANATIRRSFQGFNTAIRASYLYEELRAQFNGSIGENLAVRRIRSLDNAQSNIFISSENQLITAHSGFLIADADYKQKYIFSGLFRREGSSLFGPEQRWANYYRLSGAYRLTEDINIRGVRELKLRASIGTSGIRPTFEQRFEAFELIDGNITKKTLGNSRLRPAYSTETEVGLNASFGAFDLEFNFANILTEDQVLLAPLTAAAGFAGQWRNAGAVAAKVYEAGLKINFARLFKIKNGDINWNLMTTFDRVEQRVESLDIPAYVTGPGLQQSSLFLVEEGRALGTMVGEVFATSLDQLPEREGVNPSDFTLNQAGYVVRKDELGTPAERPFKLTDDNGNPLVQPIGDINPDFRMGFAHTIGFKGIQLYTLFDWKKGGQIYNLSKQWLYRDHRHADVSRYEEVPAGFFGNEGLYNGLVANNHFVEDAGFFMLREAALSYTFGNGAFGKWIDQFRLSLIGRNLFTLTDYSGFHPDVTSPLREENRLTNRFNGGIGSDPRTPNGDPNLFIVDAFNYPVARTLTFSIQATF